MASAPRGHYLLPGYLLVSSRNYCVGCFMKLVTIENVKARIAHLETSEQIGGRLSMRHEFELECMRQLVVSMEAKPTWAVISSVHGSREMVTSYTPGVHVDGEKGVRLAYAAQPAPVVPDDVLNRLDHEANHITAWHHMDEHSCKVNRRDLLTLVNSFRSAMLQAGNELPETDNTAQQFEALAGSKADDDNICYGERCLVCDEMIIGRSPDGLCVPCRDDITPNTEPCVICGVVSSHPKGWHYCHATSEGKVKS